MKPLHLLLKLLIAILQLLHRAGEIAQLGLKMVDAGQKVGVGRLRVSGISP